MCYIYHMVLTLQFRIAKCLWIAWRPNARLLIIERILIICQHATEICKCNVSRNINSIKLSVITIWNLPQIKTAIYLTVRLATLFVWWIYWRCVWACHVTQYHSNVKNKSVANLTVSIEFTSGISLSIQSKASTGQAPKIATLHIGVKIFHNRLLMTTIQ